MYLLGWNNVEAHVSAYLVKERRSIQWGTVKCPHSKIVKAESTECHGSEIESLSTQSSLLQSAKGIKIPAIGTNKIF
jgi:hypothetical protein